MQIPDITLGDIEQELERRMYRKADYIFPEHGELSRDKYPKHMEFLAATKDYSECAFIAGNRTGKSETVTYAGSKFLTGDYPDWWEGRVFKESVDILAAGETAKLVRDSLQEKFLGKPGAFGTGMIPKDSIIEWRAKSGIPDAVDTVRIKHISGGVSTLRFMSYDQGRHAFQATAQDVVILDEEPPEAVYMECMTRLMTKNGLLLAAFTPLRGVTELVQSFMSDLGVR